MRHLLPPPDAEDQQSAGPGEGAAAAGRPMSKGRGGSRDRSAEHSWNGSGIEKAPGARGQQSMTARPLTDMERRGCARLLASRAADAADLRELLALAGLAASD